MPSVVVEDIHSLLGKSIIHNGINYLKGDNNKYLALNGRKNMEEHIYLTLYLGNNLLNYNDIEISVNISSIGDPKDFTFGAGIYKEIELSVENKSDLSILQTFIEESKNYYKEKILCREKNKDKITVYNYDNGWVLLNKCFKRDISSIYLPNNNAKDILEDVREFCSEKTEDLYKSLGLPYKRNYLFEGYPGTGKTSLIYSLASELNYGLAIIDFDVKMTDLELKRALKNIPEETILVIEDIEALFTERKKNDEFRNSISFSGLLNNLDGVGSHYKLIIIMTTNFKCNLDPAIRRPGRIDKAVHFDYSKKDQVENMFNKFFPKHTEMFSDFYKSIEYKNVTTAVLQQYFLNNFYNEDIMENIAELLISIEEHDYSEHNKNLYM